ncbi:hypothetical protein TWF788_004178 [Orbilia oligospora]|uniref:SET domain-containing protein n=1 Tax=Orbilia oligospora TaxID=2813651 RepID=A0A6G1MHZ3_ORBOL|nr:hypothetical protein TWF788_004178 [Orbilia oligospora]KAF3221069.1 hypothetical protein TWF191_007275 [Orbilia oligospora]KAF3259057.1 hypothetical protein TWF192_011189 [Orbilia oligospora]
MLPEKRVARLFQQADTSLTTDPLRSRNLLTDALAISPYDPDLWQQRAITHVKLGYPDLATGDAYRALLLVQELLEAHEESEFGFIGLVAWRGRRAQPKDTFATGDDVATVPDEVSNEVEEIEGDYDSIPKITEVEDKDLKETDVFARRLMCSSLLEIGCLLDAWEQADASLKVYPEDEELRKIYQEADEKVKQGREKGVSDFQLREGEVARVIYPWNTFEPDRTSDETVAYLNTLVTKASSGNFEVKVTELPMLVPDAKEEGKVLTKTSRQLGVYATKDLPKDTQVFSERSILTVNNRLFDPLCDCCDGPLDPLNTFSCDNCDDVMFCSTTCKDEATEKYHPSLCGIDIDFLFKSAHTRHAVANDASATASSSTPTKALYSLLSLRTLAMALTQDANPLEILPMKYLYGSSPPPPPPQKPPTLPFTFPDNILSVFHILTRLEVDPFKVSLHTFDIWHTLTIHSKILGTASARHNPTSGQPEVAALHLCYSLVNHDCEPCLMWECQSEMKFRTLREVKKGEEVRDCYTDPRIESWKKRREWLMGSLGGGCRCGRCIRESEADP